MPGGLALGLAADWAALHRPSYEVPATTAERWLAAGDFAAGAALVVGGAACWWCRSESRSGPLLLAGGITWYLGTLAGSSSGLLAGLGATLLTLHRGPLVHAVVAHPAGRLRDRPARLLVGAVYASSAVGQVGQGPIVACGVSAALIVATASATRSLRGPLRRARPTALLAAAILGVALCAGATADVTAVSEAGGHLALGAYQGAVLCVALVLTVDLLRSRWAEGTLTGLVVELGDVGSESILRARLASTLQDPSLQVGYRRAGGADFVDERGIPVRLPGHDDRRRATLVEDEGEDVAVLVHDPATLEDPTLARPVVEAVRIAVANLRLQRELRHRMAELEASRRRLVEAGDRERRRLESVLHQGAQRRLAQIEQSLREASGDGADPAELDRVQAEVAGARRDLRELARGIHPRAVSERGLAAALAELARRAPVPVSLAVDVPAVDLPVETAAYFVCSEALTNIGKHAAATRASIRVHSAGDRLVVTIEDNGRGGATLAGGSGLRGLADRVEALGGRLTVRSSTGSGTTLVAELPLS